MSIPAGSIAREMGLSDFDISPLLPSKVSDALDGLEQLDTLGDRWEQCFERGGTPDECTKNLALCALRDLVVDQLFGNASAFAEKLQLEEVFKNYYCDGECYHCCWAPGEGADGAGGGCHTSLDASEGPVLNCNDRYGVGARGVGPALIIGDPTGSGICLGVQQVCNHIAVCNGAPTSALENGAAASPSSAETTLLAASTLLTVPAGSNMSHPGAAPARAKGFEAAMRRALTEILAETPASERRRAYLDFIMGRGAIN